MRNYEVQVSTRPLKSFLWNIISSCEGVACWMRDILLICFSHLHRFKWGVKPVMELSLATFKQHSTVVVGCFFIWLLLVLYTFSPVIF